MIALAVSCALLGLAIAMGKWLKRGQGENK